MKSGMLLVIVGALLVVFQGEANAEVKVLMIGNRFIGSGATRPMLEYVYNSSGQGQTMQARIEWICPGSLSDHWVSGNARQALTEEPWDYVILQDRAGWTAATAGGDAWLAANVAAWDAEIKLSAPTAQTVIIAPPPLPEYFMEDQAHYQSLYEGLADELGAILAPLGEVYMRGAVERPDFELQYATGAPTMAGNYLNAVALFSVLTGDSPIGVFAPPMPADDVAWVQQITASVIPEPASVLILLLADATVAGRRR